MAFIIYDFYIPCVAIQYPKLHYLKIKKGVTEKNNIISTFISTNQSLSSNVLNFFCIWMYNNNCTFNYSVFKRTMLGSYWAKHVNRTEVFFILKYLDATKFVWLSFFTVMDTAYRKCGQNYLPWIKNVYFRLTYGAQKRLCLTSLLQTLANRS